MLAPSWSTRKSMLSVASWLVGNTVIRAFPMSKAPALGMTRSTSDTQELLWHKASAVPRLAVLLCQRRYAANVVRVLMGQQNAGDIRRGQGKRLQGAAYSPCGDTGVHQKVGPAGADQQAVSLRPTG